MQKIVKRGTGGVPVAPIRRREAHGASVHYADAPSKRPRTQPGAESSTPSSRTSTNSDPFALIPQFDPTKHGRKAIRVEAPHFQARAHFISTCANFVSKDGSLMENKLRELEVDNPNFSFLTMPEDGTHPDGQNYSQLMEHIYYRWRIYAFCQGDGFNVWNTKPFMMVRPNGNFWIPPVLNQQAAQREEHERKMREESIERSKKQRRRRGVTGRQIEQARGPDGSARLTREEVDQLNILIRKKLCASRDAICEAMAFCFEKSGAAKQIAKMLKEVLLEDENSHPGISIETRVARLFLLSDVLFNSQQPGVRNAFLYRDAIERMAPDVFASLGKHRSCATIGRMTRNKLSTAVSAVLCAWTNWSVYNPTFLDELHARFEGKEIINEEETQDSKGNDQVEDSPEREGMNAIAVKVIPEKQRGDWTTVNHEQEENDDNLKADSVDFAPKDDPPEKRYENQRSGSKAYGINAYEDRKEGGEVDGEALEDDDLDGEALEEDDLEVELDEGELDGEVLEEGDLCC